MSAKRRAIKAVYAQVAAPDWAAANLDALADVLRDLSWLPDGAVELSVPDLADLDVDDQRALLEVLSHAVRDTARSTRPVHVHL
jgi:hypothetical protein